MKVRTMGLCLPAEDMDALERMIAEMVLMGKGQVPKATIIRKGILNEIATFRKNKDGYCAKP